MTSLQQLVFLVARILTHSYNLIPLFVENSPLIPLIWATNAKLPFFVESSCQMMICSYIVEYQSLMTLCNAMILCLVLAIVQIWSFWPMELIVVVEIGIPLFGLKCSPIALIVEQLQRLLDFLLQLQPMITISQMNFLQLFSKQHA
jgi:hypothetical protein